ncbi:MAG TPA: hypothetical protein VND45_12600 [Thermoanaerobaculia bacterium]|jgi:hypothetical protein|nr:hypothetical protein [Thermoanaerobaculia bacterium]
MGRNRDTKSTGLGRLRDAADAVKRMFSRSRAAESNGVEAAPAAEQPRTTRSAAPTGTARAVRREADIPLDLLDRSYTPPLTSSKSGFRSDGADHQHDQEFSRGVADADWNDEDHFTNKSGDPRIGTRRRTYEPTENRAESRDEQR